MSIKIGDNNKIKKSNIIDNNININKNGCESKESFSNKHPILSIIKMIFAFLDKILQFIKNFF